MRSTVYELLPAQKEFLFINDPAIKIDVCLYQGGFGSGKTFIGSLLGHLLSKHIPKNRGIVAAKTYPLVRDTTLRAYFDHFDRFGWINGKEYTWRATEQKIVYNNGSEILFRHLQEPNKIKSLNLGWAHLEEMSELDESAFLMVLSRLRLPHIDRYRLFGTSNPQPSRGWMYNAFQSQPEKHPTAKNDSNDGDCSPNCRIRYRKIVAPSTENSYLSAMYLDNMKHRYSETYYRRNVLGEDVDMNNNLVCPMWSVANEDESVVYRPSLRIYLSCDFNVDPMCWVIAHRILLPGGQNQFEFFDELCIENTNIVQTAEEFARRYGPHEAGIVITGDATGKNRSDASANPNDSKYRILINTLSNMGLKNLHLDAPTGNPHQDVRVESWNALVCNQAGIRRIKLNPKTCPRLLWNLNNMKYIQGASIIWEPAPRQIQQDNTHTLKFTKHPFDAASYLIYRYEPLHKQDNVRKKQPPLTSSRFRPERLI